MRNTKLIVAMLAGCMAVSGAALAQQTTDPTPSSTAATPTHTGSDAMKRTGADGMSQDPAHSGMNSSDKMKSDGAMKSDGSMKSTHKNHKMKKGDSMSEPAKSSTSGM